MGNETDDSKRRWEIVGLFIPAGLFIGMGVGWALDYLVQGLFIGLGAGFLAMAIGMGILYCVSVISKRIGEYMPKKD